MLIHKCEFTRHDGHTETRNVTVRHDAPDSVLAYQAARRFTGLDAETAEMTVFSSGEIELVWSSGSRLFIGLGL